MGLNYYDMLQFTQGLDISNVIGIGTEATFIIKNNRTLTQHLKYRDIGFNEQSIQHE